MWQGQERDESRRLVVRHTTDAPQPAALTPSIRHFSSWKIFASALMLVVVVSSIGVGGKHLKQSMESLAARSKPARVMEPKIFDPAPRIPSGCMQEGTTYLIKAILHNNLAGRGPDQGEENMLFLVSRERHGADREDFKVSVTAISSYTPHSASWNGLDGDFASINQMPGQDVKLRFQFRDMANTPMWLDSFDLLLCDLDGGSRSTDFARVFDPHEAYWGRRTKLQLKSHEDYIEYNLNYPYREVPGEKTDLGAGNPVYSGDLSQQQLQTCVSLKYRSVDRIDLALGSTSSPYGWGGVRSFFFAFSGLDHCSELQLASSNTTSATTSSSTFTRTSLTSTLTTRTTTSSISSTTKTGSTITFTTFTTSTISTLTRTTTTEVLGIPVFASPGQIASQPLSNMLRFFAMTAYVSALLFSALGVVLYWLCIRQT